MSWVCYTSFAHAQLLTSLSILKYYLFVGMFSVICKIDIANIYPSKLSNKNDEAIF